MDPLPPSHALSLPPVEAIQISFHCKSVCYESEIDVLPHGGLGVNSACTTTITTTTADAAAATSTLIHVTMYSR
jgi:hypothetical protein